MLDVAAPSTGTGGATGTVMIVAPAVFGEEYSPQPSALAALARNRTKSPTAYPNVDWSVAIAKVQERDESTGSTEPSQLASSTKAEVPYFQIWIW